MSHPFTQRRLGEILVGRQYLSLDDLEGALREEHTDAPLGQRLLRANKISEEQLAEALADQFHLRYVSLQDFAVPAELFDVLPAIEAFKHEVVPYGLTGSVFELVISDPFDIAQIERFEHLTGHRVEVLLSTPAQIKSCLKRSEGTSEILRDVTEDFRLVIVKEGEAGEQSESLEILGEDAGPVVRLINTILVDALQRRASDVHVETYEDGVRVKYRIDGVMYPATEALDRRHHGALISRLKVMAELDIAEKRIPQDGRFKLRINGRDIDFRVSILPSVFGEDVVIRVLDRSSMAGDARSLSLESLGMPAETLKKFRKAIREPYGMVLITGPTGSGKTTTLYAALSELNNGDEKIITIEDPVEYQLDGIVQIPVNEKKKLTFARGLRSILRHDPDKIMVGEIRDVETAQIAVQSALTGHLVFTTVHANNAFDVVGRFSHMGVDIYAFVSALNCVMAQRLIRALCPRCKRPVPADEELLEQSGLDPHAHADQQWFEAGGCEHCGGTGYRGRFAITEFLELSPKIREMIIDRRPLSEMRAVALEEGMVTLRQSSIAKVLAGETTLREANRVTFVD